MYGKKRLVISKANVISLKGKGSSQTLGRCDRIGAGVDVYLANGEYVAIVSTKREAKIAIFNAAKKSKDHFIGQSLTIDSNGQLSN